MDKKDEAMKLALEALEIINSSDNDRDFLHSDECEAMWVAIDALREALAEQQAPAPECQTDAEKTAFAFGWWKALESVRQQPAQQQATFTIYDGKGNVVVHLDAKPAQQEPVATMDSLEQEIYERTREFVSLNVMEWLLNRLNTSPPAQRKPLTMQERTSIVRANKSFHDKNEIDAYGIIDDVEAAHGIKENT